MFFKIKLNHLIFASLIGVSSSVYAQDATDPVAAAQAKAAEKRVPLLVDFQAPWCYSCYFMAKNVLTGTEWERAQRETVVLELDADSPEGAKWMQAWNIKALPSYVLLASDGPELGRILGEQTRVDFYHWLFSTTGRGDSLAALKSKVVDVGEPSVVAAREVLRIHHARYDAAGGLAWYVSLPKEVKIALARDAQSASWIARLELQRTVTDKEEQACVQVGEMVLSGNLGCERPYELSKVMGCAASQPEAQRRELLKPQAELMQLLLDKRVLSGELSVGRCADERSIVLTAADLHKALGDTAAEALTLERAIADVKTRIGGDPGSSPGQALKKDRNLADNLRVYLDRAGKLEDLDALLLQLIAAYPDDYVYAYRHGKNLAARGKHAEALPFYEQAAAKAYGVNRLRNAELRAKSLQALSRAGQAMQVLNDALKANGPWFPEDAAKLKALMTELTPAAPSPAAPPAT